VGAYSPGRRPWRRISTLCSHLKTRFKADIKTKICLKMLYFLEKTGKFAAALGAPPPNQAGPTLNAITFYWLLKRNNNKNTTLINSIEHRRRRRGGRRVLVPPLEINSGKFEIIRALNFGEDLFLEITLILRKKKGNFSTFGNILVWTFG